MGCAHHGLKAVSFRVNVNMDLPINNVQLKRKHFLKFVTQVKLSGFINCP